jgi:hypothetical protein
MIHLNCTASRESHVVIKIEFPINLVPDESLTVRRSVDRLLPSHETLLTYRSKLDVTEENLGPFRLRQNRPAVRDRSGPFIHNFAVDFIRNLAAFGNQFKQLPLAARLLDFVLR